MTGFGFLAPLCFGFAVLAVPIILLYMLRLRRTEVPISSNFLWQQLVRDREANAPWQRLRLNWLLLLQLLILLALILALARPFTEETTIITGRTVVLLDASASMNATDMDDGQSRFDAAKDLALDTVGNLRDGDTMTVIRVAEIPEVLVAASTDKGVLRDAIRDAESSSATADWNAALTLAAAGRIGVDDLRVVALTDGGLPPNLPTIPGEFSYVRIGESQENAAITQLSTDVLPGETPQLYYRIDNFGEQDTRVVFSISLDGDLFTAQRFDIPAGGFWDDTIEDLPDDFTELQASITPSSAVNTPDYLPTDNVAYTIYNPSGSGDVLLMTAGNVFIERLFDVLTTVELTTRDTAEGLPSTNFGLTILDGWLPGRLPEGDLLIVNPPSSTSFFTVTGDNLDVIIDPDTGGVDRNDTRTRFFDFTDVSIRTIKTLEGYDGWATPLVSTQDGHPLVLAGEVEGRQVAIITFDLHQSNLPLQITWPILVSSLMEWYQPQRVITITNSIQPGTPVTIRPAEGNEIRVIKPNGDRSEFELEETAQVIFGETNQPGLYRIEVLDDGDVVQRDAFAVNLFSERESNIKPAEDLVLSTEQGQRIFSDSFGEEIGRREWWRWLAGIGLAILAFEWWYYHRSKGRIRRAAARVSYTSRQSQKKAPRWQFWAGR